MATVPLLLGTALYFSINQDKNKSKKSTNETFYKKDKGVHPLTPSDKLVEK